MKIMGTVKRCQSAYSVDDIPASMARQSGRPISRASFRAKLSSPSNTFPQKQALQARRHLPVQGHYSPQTQTFRTDVTPRFQPEQLPPWAVVSTSCSICVMASFMDGSFVFCGWLCHRDIATRNAPPLIRSSTDTCRLPLDSAFFPALQPGKMLNTLQG